MTRPALDDIELLLIDGNNLLHRISGSADPTAVRTLIPRLRNAIPSTLPMLVMLDGHADSGTNRRERIGKGLDIRHSGSQSADDALVRVILDQSHSQRAGTTIVTDDITLANRARQLGARTQRLNWLEGLMESPVGRGSAIGGGPPAQTGDEDDDRTPWTPGRGATKKRGNPRKSPRQGRG